MTSPASDPAHVEVEAKFLGGETQYREIVDWLSKEGGFSTEPRPPVHRLHIYFDCDGVLQRTGCRLRCVIAAGEWCRYDFKAEDEKGRDETLEVSVKKPSPVPLTGVIDELLALLMNGPPREGLSQVRDSARIVLVMSGKHVKTMAKQEDLKIEVSWDVLTPIDSGIPLSEIEVELCSGERAEFDRCAGMLETTLGLERSRLSKIDRALPRSKA